MAVRALSQRAQHPARLPPVEPLGGLVHVAPAVVVVLPVEPGLPTGRRICEEDADPDLLRSRRAQLAIARLLVDRVRPRRSDLGGLGHEARLLAQLANGRLRIRLSFL